MPIFAAIMQRSVAFHTLGCKLNFAETSAIGRQFLEAGFVKKDFEEPADVYVINTCSVTDQANKQCRNLIRRAQRRNPEGYIIVTGCYAQLKPREIAEMPGVDLVLGAGEKFRALERAGELVKQDHACVFHDPIGEAIDFRTAYSIGDRTRSFLKVQDGCDYKCSFCTIPLARGRSRSDTVGNVLRNAAEISARGVQEIVLTGVNIGDYGQGQAEGFLDLIRALDSMECGPARFRISSIEPNLCDDGIISFVAASQRFMPHFHMPLQSGSDEILARMRRRYRSALYADRVASIRAALPDACIGVDVIVGFPGETEAHFEESVSFLDSLDISYLHVFTYSERENTLAAALPGAVPPSERSRRNEVLRLLSDKKRAAFDARFRGQVRPVLFEAERQEDRMQGFSDNYVKVIRPYDAALVNRIAEVAL
jgi:threonylcarbamoyladenosine tRNA methylthiotransferase MtaB